MLQAEDVSNLVILRGAVAGELLHRDLQSGSAVVQFDVATMLTDHERTVKATVPVSWVDPSTVALAPVKEGLVVVVVGTVRRRFFRVGGSTQSRTEVVAEAVIPSRRTKQVAQVLAAASDQLRGVAAA